MVTAHEPFTVRDEIETLMKDDYGDFIFTGTKRKVCPHGVVIRLEERNPPELYVEIVRHLDPQLTPSGWKEFGSRMLLIDDYNILEVGYRHRPKHQWFEDVIEDDLPRVRISELVELVSCPVAVAVMMTMAEDFFHVRWGVPEGSSVLASAMMLFDGGSS